MPNRKIGYVSPMGEVNLKPTFTESAGYRTARQQIESFLRAGEVLKSSREAGTYDSVEDDPVDERSLDLRDMELSEIGHIIGTFEAPKVVNEEETGASVSSSPVSDDKSSVQDPS